MRVIETKLPGVLIIEPEVFGDQRGFSLKLFRLIDITKLVSRCPLCRTIIHAQHGAC